MTFDDNWDYKQPDFYHFSEDSITLANYVAKTLISQNSSQVHSLLDVCCGCGIIGLDLLHQLHQHNGSWVEGVGAEFWDLQEEYHPYIMDNIEHHRKKMPGPSMHFYVRSYKALLQEQFKGRYDLIVSNPPYYHPESKRPSPDQRRAYCHLFLEGSLEQLCEAIIWALKDKGSAFMILSQEVREQVNLFTGNLYTKNISVHLSDISKRRFILGMSRLNIEHH